MAKRRPCPNPVIAFAMVGHCCVATGFEVFPHNDDGQLFCQHAIRAYSIGRKLSVRVGEKGAVLTHGFRSRTMPPANLLVPRTQIAIQAQIAIQYMDLFAKMCAKQDVPTILIRNREGGFKIVTQYFAKQHLIVPNPEAGLLED